MSSLATKMRRAHTALNQHIEEQVYERLQKNSYLALRYLKCTCEDGVVTIQGRVPSYYLKQLAQTVVGQVEGVEKVVNQVEVA